MAFKNFILIFLVFQDLDSAKIARQSLEMDIRNLQDKFKANQDAWEASKQELHSLKKSFSELDGSLKSSKEEARTAQSSLEAFRQQIATLLSSGSLTVIPSEKDILKRVQEINCKEESEERVSQHYCTAPECRFILFGCLFIFH